VTRRRGGGRRDAAKEEGVTKQSRPAVECRAHHTGLPVPDVPRAVAYYTDTLGFTLGFTWGDPASMAGVDLGEARIFLEEGTANPDGCNLYFVVGDADELHRFQADRGAEVMAVPEDRPYGLRDYAVRDLYGYRLSFGHDIYTVGDPVPIRRVEVPVRVEKRLAALLHDLAEHKRMTLGECLEEILLHTCEPLGDGVASPHTASTLRHIQELKAKHGIDYDCHASYRFVEQGEA
jgi:catechol 2,3-dioxygenase-like lactoylglutathione lyase family enzyme